VRLYLDTNVYAHAQDLGQQEALRDWLAVNGHRAVLSDVLLGEALAITDPAMRNARLRLLAVVPSRRTRSLGELQATEFLNEVRRLRPEWRRLPVGDLSFVRQLQTVHQQGWRLLNGDPKRLIARTGEYRNVEQHAIRGSRAGQQTIRNDLLAGQTIINELTLGPHRIPVRQLNLDHEDDFCRMESLFAWYGALIQELLTLSDYRNYAMPYIIPTQINPPAFVDFWLNEIDPERIPRGWATSLVVFAQLRSSIGHGNAADIRHAGHALDADLIITEDRGFYEALNIVAKRIASAAQPRFIARADTDLAESLASAVSG